MTDVGAGAVGAALAAPPASAVPQLDVDVHTDSKNEASADEADLAEGIFTSLQNALKRQWIEGHETGPEDDQGESKRIKAEPQHDDLDADAGWDIGALLESALGSMDHSAKFDEPVSNTHLATTMAAPTEQIGESSCMPGGFLASEPKKDVPASTAQTGASTRDQKKMRFSQNPTYLLRSMGLSMLGSLAVQILHALSERPRSESLRDFTSSDNEIGRCYRALRSTFCSARKMFSDSSALLIPEELDIKELGDQETIQMTNMATICSSLFEADDVSLIDMHDHFLMTFLPESGALTEKLATLFLGLKFRTLAIELLHQPDAQQRRDFLERLFPADIEDQLKQLHPEMPLSEQELSFLSDMMSAKDMLLEAIKTEESRRQLAEKFPLDAFRDDLSAYLRKNADIVLKYAETHSIEIPAEEETGTEDQSLSDALAEVGANIAAFLASPEAIMPMEATVSTPPQATTHINGGEHVGFVEDSSMSEGLTKFIQEAVQKNASSTAQTSNTMTGNNSNNNDSGMSGSSEDLSGLTMLIKEKLSQATQNTQAAQPHSPVAAANAALTSMQNTYASQLALYQSRTPAFSQQPIQTPVNVAPSGPSGLLPPNQTSPSSVLYQRARQAAAAKTTAHTRREGLHSTRRPWTPDEEQALMTGLDMVKGPHWSQILQLFGANGTISDILKDRSQVQLKDKARNLKLFFLKTNSEMPFYLHCVTGELKTRAPGQAARKEAEERARYNNEEEQARVRGIMTLAGGLQDKNKAGGSAAGVAGSAAGRAAGPPQQRAGQPQQQAQRQTQSPVQPQPQPQTPQTPQTPHLQQRLQQQQQASPSPAGSSQRPILTSASQMPAVQAALAAIKNGIPVGVHMPATTQAGLQPGTPGRAGIASLPGTPHPVNHAGRPVAASVPGTPNMVGAGLSGGLFQQQQQQQQHPQVQAQAQAQAPLQQPAQIQPQVQQTAPVQTQQMQGQAFSQPVFQQPQQQLGQHAAPPFQQDSMDMDPMPALPMSEPESNEPKPDSLEAAIMRLKELQ